ncbi:protein SUPPRESSOR OF GENE SILENCING 3-like [Abrus precatorius]|uniref:Protein SUPPRESSOR OF GENE SILENCING 3-like n=1 Tax=Abrus precatorius TaxID=3816 RepID=A0A8B8K7A9_ABRPR|nr:protein SUPPRESSOR OF GENE SILENCING 3-like [Abrus precatorius]
MADHLADPFPKLGSVYRASGSKTNHLSRNGANPKLNSKQTGDTGVKSRHVQDMSAGSAPRPRCSQNSSSNAWGDPNVIHMMKKWGNGGSGVANSNNLQDQSNSSKGLAWRGNGILNDSKLPPQSVISLALEKGVYSSVGVDTTKSKDCKNDQCKDEIIPEPHCENNDAEVVDSESDIVFDSEDEVSLDDSDSDTGEKSHERSKKSKWLRNFFDKLNVLTIEEINSQERQWHCPACKGGPGAIDWYKGLQPLLNHSRTIQARRARLHRMFAETLEEECFRRKAPLTMVSEVHDGWEGLDKKVKDHEIVWPPMVIIMNTRSEQDENSKWTGMGNQELLDCFSDYAALKARHSYGPQGHRGIGVLIFEESTAGYLEAMRLHKHFKEQGRDREAWYRCQHPFVPGGKRQLYGYFASKEDLDIFNRHSGGKLKLKFAMRSYQEMVESKIKHINDDSQQLDYFKSLFAKEQMKSQVYAESLNKISEKLHLTTEENRVVRERIEEQHQKHKEEMDAQENFFQDQMQVIQQAIAAKEDKFAKLQQAKREKVGESSEKEDDKVENISRFVCPKDEMRQFEAKRANIIKFHQEKMLALKKKQWQEQVELEKEFENELTQLMDTYTPGQSQEESCQ